MDQIKSSDKPQKPLRKKQFELKKIGYSKAQAAAVSSLSERKIDYLIKQGVLKASRIGGRIVIPASSLEALIEHVS